MTDQRADQYGCTAAVLEATPDAAVVANLGTASYVLAEVSAPDRPRNVYQWGSMGVTTAVGFGLAVSVDDQVTVFEGDGSLLMSLGVMSTVAQYAPPNLTVVLWENEVYGTTGDQESHATHTDFAGVARHCGLDAVTVGSTDAFVDAYDAAVSADTPQLIVCKVSPTDPDARPSFDYPHIARRARDALTTPDE